MDTGKRKRLELEEENVGKYVWPWCGVILNIPNMAVDEKFYEKDGFNLQDELTKMGLSLRNIILLFGLNGHSGSALVEFGRNRSAWFDALAFDRHFKSNEHGKLHWKSDDDKCKCGLYAWFANIDDYHSHGIIENFLKNYGSLKSSEVAIEASDTVELQEHKKLLQEKECNIIQASLSLEKMLDESDKLHKSYNEGTF